MYYSNKDVYLQRNLSRITCGVLHLTRELKSFERMRERGCPDRVNTMFYQIAKDKLSDLLAIQTRLSREARLPSF